ncbi:MULTISPECIES: glycerol-3-phosphate dehydrogenase/oxidase [unclassified Lentimonas]|uniref:glycerol-3-phosphate dehydrogenase/oxidase n=1 Tax=unclassified Lentimonas TaxID=2630993 RepID=UPI001320EADC|nr:MULTISPECIES: glycerol-3-phosphate dehydrogenase/oxidase [unclassified Lentimonas]CAA6689745.1 Aerobic glycerol-3-phosphate dehydrogenase (EC [Lentimonas sp. CC19]CAA6690633.1 Aerobic glycerol-3-phosphate dehydrogenase (EC [Lentimonas sp. CC10]CAA7068888.1 Aerobic glycerol-3-phosphate dehydrogenase (EC [Lentimonas sp. CC11]
MNREQSLQCVQTATQPFDIVIIGGGASGLGAAVDAAARGHRVALFEQADFAKGTSSRSTKLVHGGVRYLQQGNVSLVLEALRERGRLAKNAPHLVHSQAFVIPNYAWWEGPFYAIGMKVYDQLAGKLGLEPSRHLSRDETIAAIPTIEQDHLSGGVIYQDGQFDDSRLAINLAQTATEHDASMVNYCRCTGLIKENGKVCGVEIHDIESDTTFSVRALSVVNATGVFVDELRSIDDSTTKPIIAVSQGIHIMLPKSFLPGNAAIMIPKTADGRVLFAVPWHDHVVVGTTDTPLDSKSLEPRALAEEREFIMTHACKYLTKDPCPEDVLSVYAGLRPLVKSGDSNDTAALSRDHTILISQSGLITLTGGKWTTYRKMAEDVIDQAQELAKLPRYLCPTESMKIHGWSEACAISDHLKGYGADAKAIQAIIATDSTAADTLHPKLPYQKAEVIWHAREEMARTVEDVLARRTRALLLNAAASIEAAPVVAEILAKELGHDTAWEAKQVAAYAELAKGYLFTDSASVT